MLSGSRPGNPHRKFRRTYFTQPQLEAAGVVAVRRFETPPGRQAQVDWRHLGSLELDSIGRQLWGFTCTLGYGRMMMMAEAALNRRQHYLAYLALLTSSLGVRTSRRHTVDGWIYIAG